jgi:hypothetical protein
MIISDEEIRKCIDIIAAQVGLPKDVALTPAEKARALVYARRFENVSHAPNPRLNDVKRDVAEKDYSIDSDEVAEKLLGRVISDKVR